MAISRLGHDYTRTSKREFTLWNIWNSSGDFALELSSLTENINNINLKGFTLKASVQFSTYDDQVALDENGIIKGGVYYDIMNLLSKKFHFTIE